MKKLAVIGRGTAGALSIAHFQRWMENTEVEWHYDPNIKTQAVGEGSNLVLPPSLYNNLGFSNHELHKLDGTFKGGIEKENWGREGKWFFHDFPGPAVSYHFNALKLQDYIYEKVKDRVKIVEHNTSADNIDADFVMDCTGRPKELDLFDIPEFIPVNAVHVNQCFWDFPRFQHTLTIARKHGWVFGIPLRNRCSIGYVYNKDISTLDEIKEDIQAVFEQYGLTPSDTTNSFHFGNYYRKKNFSERIAYNGNSSFFLEPLEATSIGLIEDIQRMAFDLWHNVKDVDTVNREYIREIRQIETMIMMHYFSGSVFKTPFWDFARERGAQCMENAVKTQPLFVDLCLEALSSPDWGNLILSARPSKDREFGSWWIGSFKQNIDGLGIGEDLNKIIVDNQIKF